MHPHDRYTALGVGCLFWALAFGLAIVLLMLISSIAVVPSFYGAIREGRDPGSLVFSLVSQAALICASIVCGIAVVVFSLAGFYDVYRGRREYGPVQADAVRRARSYLVLTILFLLVFVALPRYPSMIVGLPDKIAVAPLSALVARVFVVGLTALFAGLTLSETVYGVADASQRSRLTIAIGLGIAGAVVGSLIGLIGVFATTIDQLVLAIVSGAITGEGTLAVSLLLFFLVFREIRDDLEAGRVEVGANPPGEAPHPVTRTSLRA